MESKRDKEAYYYVNIVLLRISVAEISFVRNAIFHRIFHKLEKFSIYMYSFDGRVQFI